jgi:2-methylcitrate dehydratase PrpD
MEFKVEPIVVKIADERMARFGKPSSDLTAKFDTRFCAAAAWIRGEFTLAEMMEPAYTDPEILALREKIVLLPDATRPTFDGCSLTVYFTDGTTEHANVDDFVGTPGNRMTDEQLSNVFRVAARGLVPQSRIEDILEAAWSLDTAADIRGLMNMTVLATPDENAK